MSRPIGKSIRLVCEAVEADGASNYRRVAEVTGLPVVATSRYATRAEGWGLLSIDRTTKPATYVVVRGWRLRVEVPTKAAPARPRPVNSVFQLGSRAGVLA
jgi:hypothetical protein